METLITTLITALLTGLTILTYRHPDGYKKIYSYISILILVVIVSISSWNIGIGASFSKTVSYIQVEKFDLAEKMKDNLMVPLIYIWTVFLVNFYLLGLQYLHLILKGKKKEPAEE